LAGIGKARLGEAWRGKAGGARIGPVGSGVERPGVE